MKLIYSVSCAYCGAREGASCQTCRGNPAAPHAERVHALQNALQRRPTRAGDPLKATTIELLRLAADAWSVDAMRAAERLIAAAWVIYADREFVDEEAQADA